MLNLVIGLLSIISATGVVIGLLTLLVAALICLGGAGVLILVKYVHWKRVQKFWERYNLK